MNTSHPLDCQTEWRVAYSLFIRVFRRKCDERTTRLHRHYLLCQRKIAQWNV